MVGQKFMVLVATLVVIAGCGGTSGTTGSAENGRNGDAVLLVTGATGTQGGAVARELLSRGHRVRALTRNPDQPAAQALQKLGAEIVQGDFNDAASLRRAMAGVSGVFGVSTWDRGTDQEVVLGKQLMDAAAAVGIGHFVYTSVAGADLDSGLAHFDSKYELEQHRAHSGWTTSVSCGLFESTNNWRWTFAELQNGRYIEPRDLSAHHQWIAASDIGFFVAEAFDHPSEWIGRTVEIAGDEMTLGELRKHYLPTRLGGRSCMCSHPGTNSVP
ncbi:MAG: NmrA/HSCARG family protein [Woeseiaceae bacterium]|nr:NmrA/HSCARG family protein [Woeseiaceae bacterium]